MATAVPQEKSSANNKLGKQPRPEGSEFWLRQETHRPTARYRRAPRTATAAMRRAADSHKSDGRAAGLWCGTAPPPPPPAACDVPPCAAASCREDDGRSVEVGCQEQTSNHPKRLASRVLVVSVGETSSVTRQVWIRKTNASEPLLTRREPAHDIETDGGWYRRDESGGWPEGCPGGVRRAGGVSLIQASLRNCGNQSSRCEGSRSSGDPTRT